MPGPDLTRATARVQDRVMNDRVRIERDPDRTDDDDFDPLTGTYSRPADDMDHVWTGPFAVLPLAGDRAAPSEGGPVEEQSDIVRYRGLGPLTMPRLRRHDVVTVLTSKRDPQLVGARFAVVTRTMSTFAVYREVRLVELADHALD